MADEFTAAELLEQTFPPLTARELLDSRQCSAMCLLGREAGYECICVCGGEFHGVLADAEVPKSQHHGKWWEDCQGYSDGLLDQLYPVATTWAKLCRQRRDCERGNAPLIAIEKRGGKYRITFDAWTVAQTAHDDDVQWGPCGEVVHELFRSLLSARRCRTFTSPNTWCSVEGITSQREAQVVASLLSEGWYGNPSGLERALWVLRGEQPRA